MLQLKLHMVTIEDLVPEDHFLRKLDAALDLSFVYGETEGLYSKKYGRPPIDPVVLVKYLLVGFLYGIPSERQIEQRIQTDVALRWYLELDLFDRVPDHSTISQLRRRKPSFRKVFRRLFERVVRQCIEAGLASGQLVGTDSTHIKANASRASEELVEIQEEAGATQSPPFPPPQTGQHPRFIPGHLSGPTTRAEHEPGAASPTGPGGHRHTGQPVL